VTETVLSERRVPLSQRSIAAIIAIAIEILLIIGLIELAPKLIAPQPPKEIPTTFSLSPSNEEQAQTTKAAHRSNAQQASGKPIPATQPHSTPPTPQPPTPITTLPGVIPMNLSSSDVSNIHAPPGQQAQQSADDGNGKDSESDYGPGAGPGGQRLYRAEWYREPTDAELSYYLPKQGVPPGAVALIACRTIDHYHVDNCRELDETPEGSGVARAMRQAAWQFLVRPPRVGGHVMVGAWVSIRIDFTRTKHDESGSNSDGASSPER
jgi:hypothetical protein